jgi:hypothetical protein
MSSPVLALVNDLFFYSRIRQAAKALGFELQSAEAAALPARTQELGARAVIVELGPGGLDATLQGIRALKADAALAGVRVVAFGSHIQTDVLEAARQAGCDEVYARSEFTARLAEILRGPSPAGSP